MSNKHRDAYEAHVKRSLTIARADVEKFAKALVANPVFALEWSDSVYLDGARVALFSRINVALEHDVCQLEHIIQTLETEIMDMARHIHNRATSAGKNRFEDCKLSVWTDELQTVRSFYEREQHGIA